MRRKKKKTLDFSIRTMNNFSLYEKESDEMAVEKKNNIT
jgi:hypothetical protein